MRLGRTLAVAISTIALTNCIEPDHFSFAIAPPPLVPWTPTPLQALLQHGVCTALTVTIELPANYDAPPYDDTLGAQAGTWTAPSGTVLGFSFEEDAIVYRNLWGADRCPVYP